MVKISLIVLTSELQWQYLTENNDDYVKNSSKPFEGTEGEFIYDQKFMIFKNLLLTFER